MPGRQPDRPVQAAGHLSFGPELPTGRTGKVDPVPLRNENLQWQPANIQRKPGSWNQKPTFLAGAYITWLMGYLDEWQRTAALSPPFTSSGVQEVA